MANTTTIIKDRLFFIYLDISSISRGFQYWIPCESKVFKCMNIIFIGLSRFMSKQTCLIIKADSAVFKQLKYHVFAAVSGLSVQFDLIQPDCVILGKSWVILPISYSISVLSILRSEKLLSYHVDR